MQEELFQQSVEATQLHSANQLLTAHLAKAEDKSSALQASITALNDDKLKVTFFSWTLLLRKSSQSDDILLRHGNHQKLIYSVVH